MNINNKSSKPKVIESSNNALHLSDTKITIYHILPHFILTVQAFINEVFERNRRRLWIPKDIKDLVSFFYAKPIIINVEYDGKTKCILQCPVYNTPIFMVKLNLILNKTNEFETKTVQQIIDIIDKYASTKQQMKMMISLILEFALKGHCNESIKVLNYLYAHSLKMTLLPQYEWMLYEDNISKTMRHIVIQKTNDLFQEHCIDHKKRDNFIAVISLVAALYNDNVDFKFITKNLIFKGIFDVLLPPENKNLAKIDLEGLCILFKVCGKKLDLETTKNVDKYLKKLILYQSKFDLATQHHVEQIQWMRKNQWDQSTD